MSKSTSTRAFLLLLVLGAAATLLLQRRPHGRPDPLVGQMPYADLNVAHAKRVSIKAGESEVVLEEKGGQGWVLANDADFPADAAKLVRLFDELMKVKVERVVARSKDQWGEFGLADGSAKEVGISGDGVAVTMRLGGERSGGGQYATINDSDGLAYLLASKVNVDASIDTWQYKTLLDIKSASIKQVVFAPGSKDSVVLTRDKAEDDLTAVGLAAEDVKANELKAVLTSLENLAFEKRFDPGNVEATTALKNASKAEVILFDGRRYELHVGRVGQDAAEKFFVRVTGHSSSEGGESQELSGQVESLNTLMQKWAFSVSSWRAQKLVKSRPDFITAKKKS